MKDRRRSEKGARYAGLWRVLQCCLLISPIGLALFSMPSLARSEEGVRADLPAGGELRIENRRGNVSLEVWKEKHVSVTAT